MAFLFDTEEEQETRKGRRSAALGHAVGTDTEIALGTRSLLGIFFGLVLICAVFFGLGYSVGRGSGSHAAAQTATDTPVPANSQVSKPSPEQSLTPVEAPLADSDQEKPAAATSEPGMQPVSAPAYTSAGASPAPAIAQPASASLNPGGPAPQPKTTPPAIPAAAAQSFMVQIAAVRVAQDAQILVDALKKHGYSAVVRNEPQDQLLHIQLGPFTSRADANAMRAKLLADGYNAVVK
jgi:cell division septation protein DedD